MYGTNTASNGTIQWVRYITNSATTCSATTFTITTNSATGGTFAGRDGRLKSFPAGVEEKARSLLMMVLSPSQRKEFKAKQEFTARSKSGRIYSIQSKWAGGIMALDKKGKAVAELCLVDNEKRQEVPVDDLLVARKLMIEAAEDEFLKIAAFHWGESEFNRLAA